MYKNSPHTYLYDAARMLRSAAALVSKAADLLDNTSTDNTQTAARKIMDQALANMHAAEARIRPHTNYAK